MKTERCFFMFFKNEIYKKRIDFALSQIIVYKINNATKLFKIMLHYLFLSGIIITRLKIFRK